MSSTPTPNRMTAAELAAQDAEVRAQREATWKSQWEADVRAIVRDELNKIAHRLSAGRKGDAA